MGPPPLSLRSSLQNGLDVWRRQDVGASASPLAALAKRIMSYPILAGENRRFLKASPRVVPSLWWVPGKPLSVTWTGNPQTLDGQTLASALQAERNWRRTKASIQSRAALVSAIRDAYTSIRNSADRSMGTRAFEPRASLSLAITSGVPALNSLRYGLGKVEESLRTLLPADTAQTWEALHAEEAHWRRAADALWRVLTTPATLPPEPGTAVILQSSPCGIRRLTAVRVPRAPGSERTSPIPNSSSLVAA